MFKKFKLKNQIKACKKEIEELESRRIRSQAALVEAILTNSVPDDADVDYFNAFTEKINNKRDEMRELQKALDELQK